MKQEHSKRSKDGEFSAIKGSFGFCQHRYSMHNTGKNRETAKVVSRQLKAAKQTFPAQRRQQVIPKAPV